MTTPLSHLGPIKLFGLLQRRLDKTLDDFHEHWQTAHRDEAMKLTSFFTAYNQNQRLDRETPGWACACDGAPELWFETFDKIVQMQSSDEYMSGAYIDEPNFMHGRAGGFAVQDRVVRAGPVVMPQEATVRANVFVRRRADRDIDAFGRWMAANDQPLVSLTEEPLRHVRSLAVQAPDDIPAYDAVESYWWSDLQGFERSWGEGALTPLAEDWVDRRASGALLCQELRVVWPSDGVDFSA